MARIPVGVGPKLPQIVVLFGASGDLAHKKLLPGLFHLVSAGFIAKCRIIGVSLDAIDAEGIGGKRIGRIHGARDQTYTSGVICAKVARYWERIHHPDRRTEPLRLKGPKGSGQLAPISWNEA